MKWKSAVKIWNRKSVASVQAGDKSSVLHTQTQGFCGWVTPSTLGALRVAVHPRPPRRLRTTARHPVLHTADPTAWYTHTDSGGFKGICERGEDWQAPTNRQPWESNRTNIPMLYSNQCFRLLQLIYKGTKIYTETIFFLLSSPTKYLFSIFYTNKRLTNIHSLWPELTLTFYWTLNCSNCKSWKRFRFQQIPIHH